MQKINGQKLNSLAQITANEKLSFGRALYIHHKKGVNTILQFWPGFKNFF
jgi:hypothetical protein